MEGLVGPNPPFHTPTFVLTHHPRPPVDGLEGLEQDYEIEATSSPSGATHVTFTRASA
jgi:hypothetical protein